MAEAIIYLTTPSLDLFGPPALAAPPDRQALARRAGELEALLDRSSASARVTEVRLGPVLTTFLLELAPGVRLRQIAALTDDIAGCLRAPSVEVESRPSEALVGVQIPEKPRRPVVFGDSVGSAAFAEADGALPIALGSDSLGAPVVADLADLQHLLIVGRQGAGKTNAVHAILQSLLFRFGTARLWLLVAGSRPTDYVAYEDIPHMLGPIAADGVSLRETLRWLQPQIGHRQRLLRRASARSLEVYNDHVEQAEARGTPITWEPAPGVVEDAPFLSRIVTVVDALDELVDDGWPEELLEVVHRGASVGVHLVVVAQRVTAKALEDLLRHGSVARLCLQASTARESVSLIGTEGAERLGMHGDAYLLPPNSHATRVHLPLVVEEELAAVGDHWRTQGGPLNLTVPDAPTPSNPSPEEELYERALASVLTEDSASTSRLQRTLRIGYSHAAALIERMEREGHVGRPDALGRREVLGSQRAPADGGGTSGRSWLPWRR